MHLHNPCRGWGAYHSPEAAVAGSSWGQLAVEHHALRKCAQPPMRCAPSRRRPPSAPTASCCRAPAQEGIGTHQHARQSMQEIVSEQGSVRSASLETLSKHGEMRMYRQRRLVSTTARISMSEHKQAQSHHNLCKLGIASTSLLTTTGTACAGTHRRERSSCMKMHSAKACCALWPGPHRQFRCALPGILTHLYELYR